MIISEHFSSEIHILYLLLISIEKLHTSLQTLSELLLYSIAYSFGHLLTHLLSSKNLLLSIHLLIHSLVSMFKYGRDSTYEQLLVFMHTFYLMESE